MKNICLKHSYRPVNNRYKNGKPVIEGGEWVTEIKCENCDKIFEEPKWKEKIKLNELLPDIFPDK